MNWSPSPRARFLAVIALILATGGGAYLLISGTSESDSSGSTTPLPLTQTQTKSTRTTTTKKPQDKNEPREGLAALEAALVQHPVVVVSLYAPDVSIDESAMEEAKAGASTAGAGFVAFNIYDEKQARQLGSLLGDQFRVINPEVLFFKRPRKLAFELRGFADSQVVAQAAKNVYPVIEPWVSEANRICRRYSSLLGPAQAEAASASLQTAPGRKKAAEALEKAASALNEEAIALGRVHADVSKATSFATLIADLREVAANMTSEAQALRKNDLIAAEAAESKNDALIEAIRDLSSELQLSSCSA